MADALRKLFAPDSYVQAERIVALARAAQEAGRGFSAIRFNDGEGIFYGYPDLFSQKELNQILNIWWGRTDQDPALLADLRRDLGHAVAGASVLGTPPPDKAQGKFLRTLSALAESGLVAEQTLSLARFHRDLAESEAFTAFMRAQKRVVLITCRDVREKLAALYAIPEIEVMAIPEEAAFARKSLERPHFPGRYLELRRELGEFPAGTVAIIGAGVCGKVYAEDIRRRGGIAFDLGSILDLWAGKATRDFIGKTAAELGDEEREFLRLQKQGNQAERQGETLKALEIRLRLVEISPYHGKSHFDLARMAQALGREDLAQQHARRAAELRPENEQFEALSRSLTKEGHS